MITIYKDMDSGVLIDKIEEKILFILNDLVCKNNSLISSERSKLIKELVDVGGEYTVAYEMLLSVIFSSDCIVSGKTALYFVELSILFKNSVDYDSFY